VIKEAVAVPIRKLSRGGPQEQIEPESAVSGAIVELLAQEQEQEQSQTRKPRKLILPEGLDRTRRTSKGSKVQGQAESPPAEAKAEGNDQGGAQPETSGHPATKSLEASANEILAALHESKRALAKEMESNLKQLKVILQETQRIAKEMEAVLREAKNEPELGVAQPGGAQDPRKAKSEKRQQGKAVKAPQWEPPDYKQKGEERWESQTGATPRRVLARRAGTRWEPPRKKDEQMGSSEQPH
jgi:hypothetical protein